MNAKLFMSVIQANRYASLVIGIYYELRRSWRIKSPFRSASLNTSLCTRQAWNLSQGSALKPPLWIFPSYHDAHILRRFFKYRTSEKYNTRESANGYFKKFSNKYFTYEINRKPLHYLFIIQVLLLNQNSFNFQ